MCAGMQTRRHLEGDIHSAIVSIPHFKAALAWLQFAQQPIIVLLVTAAYKHTRGTDTAVSASACRQQEIHRLWCIASTTPQTAEFHFRVLSPVRLVACNGKTGQ